MRRGAQILPACGQAEAEQLLAAQHVEQLEHRREAIRRILGELADHEKVDIDEPPILKVHLRRLRRAATPCRRGGIGANRPLLRRSDVIDARDIERRGPAPCQPNGTIAIGTGTNVAARDLDRELRARGRAAHGRASTPSTAHTQTFTRRIRAPPIIDTSTPCITTPTFVVFTSIVKDPAGKSRSSCARTATDPAASAAATLFAPPLRSIGPRLRRRCSA